MTLDEAFLQLKQGFEAERLAQAYIIAGPPRGAGGELATRVLRLVFCESADPPCGTCRRCGEVAEHLHPDMLWVEPQKKSRIISVGQIREVEQRIYHTSFAGGWKGCVLLGADRLSPGAANAFLKTLEEPPARSVFLLVTDSPQFLLPTIISRCQRIALSGDYGELPAKWRSQAIDVLTDRRTEGSLASLSKSDRLVGLLKEIRREAAEEVAEKMSDGGEETPAEVLDARTSAVYREMRTALLRLVLRWQRDILLLVCGGDERLLHNGDQIELMREIAKGVTYRDALRGVAEVETMNRRLESNLPDGQVLAVGLNRLT